VDEPVTEPEPRARERTPAQLAAQKAKREGYAQKNPFLSFLGRHGVSMALQKDIVGETGRRGNRMIPYHGPMFRRDGLNIDMLAERAIEAGFLSASDVADAADNGGTRKLADMILRAFQGERVLRPDEQTAALEQEMQSAYDDFVATESEQDGDAGSADEPEVDEAAVALAEAFDEDEVNALLAEVGYGAEDLDDAQLEALADDGLRLLSEEAEGAGDAVEAVAAPADAGDRPRGGDQGDAPRPQGLIEQAAADAPPADLQDSRQDGQDGQDGQGDFTLTGQTPDQVRAADDARRRDEAERARRDAAPSPDDFVLTGSNSPADQARARGQMELGEAPAAAPTVLQDGPQDAQDAQDNAAPSPAPATPTTAKEPTREGQGQEAAEAEVLKAPGGDAAPRAPADGPLLRGETLESETAPGLRAGDQVRVRGMGRRDVATISRFFTVKRPSKPDVERAWIKFPPGVDPEHPRGFDTPRDVADLQRADSAEPPKMKAPPKREKMAAPEKAAPPISPEKRAKMAAPEKVAAPAAAAPRASSGISDAGEKIGGARKDLWRERGLNLDDLESMTEAEGATVVNKQNVWKPDWEAMAAANGEPVSAAMVKVLYDGLAAKPKANTPDGRRRYVRMMQIVRDVYGSVRTVKDVQDGFRAIREKAGVTVATGIGSGFVQNPDAAALKDARTTLFSVYKGRSDPFTFSVNELMRAKKLVEDGFPAKAEPWRTRFAIRRRDGSRFSQQAVDRVRLDSGVRFGMNPALTDEQIRAGYFEVVAKAGGVQAMHATEKDAVAAARALYERQLQESRTEEKQPERPHLDVLKREGLEPSMDRDVAPDDMLRDFGFRGIEWGNWAAQDERQRMLNMAYDALSDLAKIMRIPRSAISLNGTLGLAFGARGGGRFAAHYEPGKLVINITKLRGAGSVAHEWLHALDHYFGELGRPDAYKTAARGASGWYSEEQYNGLPRTRFEQNSAGERVPIERMRLANLRPELAAAFDGVMRALFQDQLTQAQMIREQELAIERAEGYAATETDAATKRVYETRASELRKVLDDIRRDPESTLYSGRGRTAYAKEAQKLSGKSSNGYWLRPTEMFARAFESWVFDKLVAMGARSDFLVHGVESDRFAGGGYKGNPYPVGVERERINAAFDNLVATIKTRDEGPRAVMFSRPAGAQGQETSIGKIDAEMARAIGRQPGEIRLRDGDNIAGRQHIEQRHGEQLRRAGFSSVDEFVKMVASDFDAIYSRPGRSLSLVRRDSRGMLVVQLEPSESGDFYDVKTATLVRSDQFKNRVPLWNRAGPSAPSAEAAPVNPSGQSSEGSVAPAPSGNKPGPAARRGDGRAGMPIKRLTKIVDGIRSRWANAPDIEVVASAADLPDRVRAEIGYQEAGGAQAAPQGVYWSGTVYLVADQLPTEADVVTTLMHEAAGHFGLRGAFGNRLDAILDRVALARPQRMREKARDYGLSLSDIVERRAVAEEILAEMAAEQPELSLVQRAVAAIRQWVREVLGLDLQLTDADIIAQAILPARDFVERGRRPQLRDRQPSPVQRGRQRALRDAEQLTDITQRATFREEGLRGLEIPQQRVVLSIVVRAIRDAEIRREVVQLVPVDVVHNLAGRKGAAESLLSEPSVLKDLAAIDSQNAIPVRVDAADALVRAVARIAAERLGASDEGSLPFALDAAMGAAEADSPSSGLAEADVAAEGAGARPGPGGASRERDAAAGTGKIDGTQDAAPVSGVERDASRGEARGASPIVAASRASATFYSELARRIGQAKASAMPAREWANWLDANAAKLGVKADEVEWSGIREYLALRGKERTTKEEILDFLGANGVQVDESVFGGGESPEDMRERLQAEMESIENAARDRGWLILTDREYGSATMTLVDNDNDVDYPFDPETNTFESDDGEAPPADVADIARRVAALGEQLAVLDEGGAIGGQVRYSGYRVPGGEDYREMLLTLPSAGPRTFTIRVNQLRPATYEFGGVEYETADEARAAESAARRSEFRSNHWDEPNVLVHTRFDTRTDAEGRKVLFVHEIQSDWGQAGRKRGFKEDTSAERAQAQKAIDAADTELENLADVIRANQASTRSLREQYMKALDESERHPVESRRVEARERMAALEPLREAAITKGRELGDRAEQLRQQRDAAERRLRELALSGSTPRAPFVTDTKAWVGLALKRLIRYAAESGHERVVLTTGEQAAETFDLSKQISKIRYGTNPDSGTYNIAAYAPDASLAVTRERITLDQVEELVGKEIAAKIERMEGNDRVAILRESRGDHQRELTGLDLKVGGEGMKAFYDRLVPQVARDVVKKLGAGRVAPVAMPDGEAAGRWRIFLPDIQDYSNKTFDNEREARAFAQSVDGEARAPTGATIDQVAIDITPELRSKAMAGMPMFQRGPRAPSESEVRAWSREQLVKWLESVDAEFRDPRPVEGIRVERIADGWIVAEGPVREVDPENPDQVFDRREDAEQLARELRFPGDEPMSRDELLDVVLTVLRQQIHPEGGAAVKIVRPAGASNDVRFKRPGRRTWDTPEPSKMDDFLYTLQDKQIDMRRVVQAIKAKVGQIADRWNPYLQEELYHGRTAKRVKDFLDFELRPLLTDMQMRGVALPEFEKFLHARHAEERNVQIAKINPKMPDGGSGMTTADAQAYLAGLDPAKRRAYEALAAKVDAITKGTRDGLVADGLEKQEAIDRWTKAYSNYVPLMREEVEETGAGTGMGFSVRGPASRRAMGSDKGVVDILANLAMQRERAIIRAEKNRVATALYGLAVKNPNTEFWKPVNPRLFPAWSAKQKQKLEAELLGMGLDPVDAAGLVREPVQRYVDPRDGLVHERVNPALRGRDNVLSLRVNGEDRFLFFNATDERAARMAHSLKNLDVDQLGRVLSASAVASRWFASVNTQYNPIFGVVNLTRDVQSALFNLSTTPIAGKQAAVLGHTVSALRGIYADIRAHRAGKAPRSTWAQLWEEFQREGGQTGFRDMWATAGDRTKALESEIRQIGEGKARGAGRAIFAWLSDYNETLENATRLAAYKVALDAGQSKQQAASIAKNLTVNFNRKGQITQQAGALYAFFNASVQGTARLAETLAGPKGRKIIAGGLILGVAQAMLLAAAGFDDDDPPEFVRERNLVIPIGGQQYVTIPMPLGLHVLPSFSRITTEWVLSGFRKPADRLAAIVSMLAETFNPIGNAGLSLQTITPTVVDPLAALAENKDFTGRPIARENINTMQPKPGFERTRDSASWAAKQLAYWLNAASGGTDFTPGLLSPTPDQIDYLVGQVTGGVGRELLKAQQTAGGLASGEEIAPYKMPLVGRFYGDASSGASESARFFDNLKTVYQAKAEMDGRRRAGESVAAYMREHPESRLVTLASQIDRDIDELRKDRREAAKRGASAEQLRRLDDAIKARMAAFNRRIEAVAG
jgi:hypothetical protein